MKPIIILIIIVLFPLSAIISQNNSDNILINGGFESGKSGKLPDGWNGDKRFYSIDKEAISGSYSLKYSNNNPSIYPICSQNINLKPGVTYSAGAMIKTSNVSGNDFGASFCIEWLDENGKWLGGNYPQGIKGTNNWTKISTIFTMPGNATKALFCCYVRKGMTGTAWFDEVYLKPYSTDKMDVILLSPVYRGLIFEDGNPEINISVNLSGFKNDLAHFGLTGKLIDSSGKEFKSSITEIEHNNLQYQISIDSKDIPIGSYLIKVNLIGKNNKLLDSWESVIKKISAADKPLVYFDDYKRLIVNGKEMFPLGMYWGSINEPDLKIYADSKFNFLLPYSPPTDDQMLLAEKYKLRVIFSVKDYYQGLKFAPPEIKSLGDEAILLNKKLQHFKDSPSLLGWYNNDELTLDYIDRLDDHYKQISSTDPNHPVLSIIINPDQSEFYTQSCDVIGSDPYVIPKSPLYNVGMAAYSVNESIEYSRPVWMVIQAHNIGNYREFIPDPENYRSPTYDEMRSMAWQSICEGASGLLFYSFFDLKRNPDVPFDTQWSYLKKIAEEIANVSDILLSVEKADGVKIEGIDGDNSWFNWIAKNYNNHLYIFVVSNGKGAGNIKINIPGNYSGVHIMNEQSHKLPLINSEFSDSLRNMELKVYLAEF